MKITNFILDVDGVMTDGKIYYNHEGKIFKVFGPHDSDGLKLIKDKVSIEFITADESGFHITHRRIVDHMGYKLTLVKEKDRFNWFKDNFDLTKVAFMGDGIFDAKIFPYVSVSISPKNARIEAKMLASYTTPSNSSEGAVLDACLYLKENWL